MLFRNSTEGTANSVAIPQLSYTYEITNWDDDSSSNEPAQSDRSNWLDARYIIDRLLSAHLTDADRFTMAATIAKSYRNNNLGKLLAYLATAELDYSIVWEASHADDAEFGWILISAIESSTGRTINEIAVVTNVGF